jgi:hypothetical protein
MITFRIDGARGVHIRRIVGERADVRCGQATPRCTRHSCAYHQAWPLFRVPVTTCDQRFRHSMTMPLTVSGPTSPIRLRRRACALAGQATYERPEPVMHLSPRRDRCRGVPDGGRQDLTAVCTRERARIVPALAKKTVTSSIVFRAGAWDGGGTITQYDLITGHHPHHARGHRSIDLTGREASTR